jgi:phage/plasmid-associated DNA primase
MANKNMNIIDFCNKHNILWQPLNLEIIEVENEKPKKIPKYFSGAHCPKNDDLKNFGEDVIKQRHVFLDKAEYIGIYTNNIAQIDVDNEIYFSMHKKINAPYFNSVKKKMPHYFVKLLNKNKNVRTGYKYCDILCGTWSYCKKDEIVYNTDLDIPEIDFDYYNEIYSTGKEFYYIYEALINTKFVYEEWYNIICALYNSSVRLNFIKPLNIVHIFCKNLKDGKYDNKAIKTIDDLPNNTEKYKFDINYIKTFLNDPKINRLKINSNEFDKSILENLKFVEEEEEEEKQEKNKKEKNKNIKEDVDDEDCIFYKNEKYISWKNDWENDFFSIKKGCMTYHDKYNELESFNSSVQGLSKVFTNVDFMKFDKSLKIAHKKKEIKVSMLELWLKDPKKRSYEKFDFIPENCPNNIYNMWKGYKIESLDLKFTEEDINYTKNVFEKYIKHMSSENNEVFNYLFNFLADIIQNPGRKPGIVILITGDEGTGKGLFNRLIKTMIGEYFYSTSDIEQIVGRFTKNLSRKIVVNLDEAVSYEVFQKNNSLKNLITENVVKIEQKGKDAYDESSYHRLIITTNDKNPIKISTSDRRTVVINPEIINAELVDDICNVLDNDIYSYCLYNILKNKEIEYKHIRDWQTYRPKTEIYNDIKNHSIPNEILFLYNFLNNSDNEEISILNIDFFSYYEEYCKKNKRDSIRPDVFSKQLLKYNKNSPGCVQNTKSKTGRGKLFVKTLLLKELDKKYNYIDYNLQDVKFIDDNNE